MNSIWAKSSAEGLVNGLDNALTQVAADQADKVRECLKPVRERLLDVMLPAQNQGQAEEMKKEEIEKKVDAAIERGAKAENDSDHDLAIAEYTEALKLRPDNTEALQGGQKLIITRHIMIARYWILLRSLG